MAVLYDPATLDLSDASVADRLRKQAKTRAVKVCALLALKPYPTLPVDTCCCHGGTRIGGGSCARGVEQGGGLADVEEVAALQVLREAIGNKAYGITMRMLRGHEGAMGLAHRLRDALGGLLQQVDEDPAAAGAASDGKYVVFAARNKATRYG